jgi:N-acetylglucosamine-6-phosphate deacetylase
MQDAFKNVLSLGFSITEVSRMASANPAKLLGLQSQIGSIKKGLKADLIVLDSNGKHISTILGGRIL